MESPENYTNQSHTHISGHGANGSWRDQEFWVSPTATLLPFLDVEVPLLTGSIGQHIVPLAPLCRSLGIDASKAIRCSQGRLLWSSAELLPLRLPQGGRRPPFIAFAWCLEYPLSTGYWLSHISPLIRDQRWHQRVQRFTEAASHLSGMAFDLMHERYEIGRQGMYALVTATAHLSDISEQLRNCLEHHKQRSADSRGASTQGSAGPELHAAQWLSSARAFLDQAQVFLHDWSEQQRHELIVDTVRIDEHNQTIGDAEQFALFAVFTEDQQRQLSRAQADCARLTQEGEQYLQACRDNPGKNA